MSIEWQIVSVVIIIMCSYQIGFIHGIKKSKQILNDLNKAFNNEHK